ncbi:RNA polymerase factor sigma-70 RpoD [[Clostridium] sordellii]|uniref:sigma-70 family RNA polymerase sigma factor n=1 Tax=Paraclostridium sordellii TaxID=1505 RepID=UPI0005DCC2B7|nr:RNA polymerase sigma factor RpoD/SigA [Paeniclostridium sordellii]CEO35455.1 RNA polymerase factor sigma-70 RpoD [[Clostridium] sordellii] [Paeniclostridium sordellii]CEP92790.1 RNA polymerase factor sigma-70 RpoD [[Clostridium] sordellii] [Paeniclostridium sordellii]
MNVEYLMYLLKDYINENKELLKEGADNILKKLSKKEQQKLIELFKKEGIKIVDKFEKTHKKEDNKSDKKQEQVKKQTKTLPPISNKKVNIGNEQLCLMYQRGDEHALDLLAIKNQALLKDRASKYIKAYNHKLEFEDLEQYAFLGLERAARGFDDSKGFKFTTYAVNWIDQSITRSIMDYGFTVRVPVHIFDKIKKVIKSTNTIHFDREKDLVEYLKKTEGYSESKCYEIIYLYKYLLKPTSLDTPIGESEESSMLDILVADEEQNIENIIIENEFKDTINTVLSYLTEKEEHIIRLRFGLDDDKPRTLEQIGEIYGVTRERIRQIESKALTKLKHPSRIKYLKTFMEAI